MITSKNILSRLNIVVLCLSITSILCAIVLFITPIKTVHALPSGDTFTVTNTNNSGVGSLRQAIADANNNGNSGEQDIIEFNIAGAGDKLILNETDLVITQPVLINGFSQGDARENTTAWPAPLNGLLRIEIYNDIGTGGVKVESNDVTLKGLVINSSPTINLTVSESDNFILQGSYIGVRPNGHQRAFNINNDGGIFIEKSDNILVGGTEPDERNIIGGCFNACIDISGTSDNTSENPRILGNFIGVAYDSLGMINAEEGAVGINLHRYVENAQVGDDSGTGGNTIANNFGGALWAQDISNLTIQGNRIYENMANGYSNDFITPFSNGAGIYLAGVTHTLIGGASDEARNVIAGNEGSIYIQDSPDTSQESSEITIENNYIGVQYDNETKYPNSRSGITIQDNSQYIAIKNNVIKNTKDNYINSADTTLSGVSINGSSQNISVTGNSIYNNSGIGIDINHDGPTDNDNQDTDGGPNNSLNYPTYYEVTENDGNTTIEYSYSGQAGQYRIEFFSNTEPDDAGSGEGETFIGYDEITKTNSDTEYYTVTIPGTNHENIALTATEINNSSPTGYGATSEFGAEGDPPPPPLPVTDLSIEKKLLNPEDYETGNVLQYEIRFINNGPDSIDIGPFDGSTPGLTHLFMDLMPPELTYAGVSGTNISCISLGPESAAMLGPSLGDHADHEVVSCGYTAGSHILHAGEYVTATLSVTVLDDSQPNIKNYVVANVTEFDPSYEDMTNAFTSGNDVITIFENLSSGSMNNFYFAPVAVSDLDVAKTVVNPGSVQTSSTIEYELSLTNNGPSPVDLTYFNSSGANPITTSLFIDILPDNLTYIGSSNPDIACADMGPASIGIHYFFNHINARIILCTYIGAETNFSASSSISTTITAGITGPIDEGFVNYALSGLHSNDPDYIPMYDTYWKSAQNYTANLTEEGDVFDLLGTTNPNNFAQALYTPNDDSGNGDGGNGNNGGNNNGNNNGNGPNNDNNADELVSTGLQNGILIALSLILVGTFIIGSAVYVQQYSKD